MLGRFGVPAPGFPETGFVPCAAVAVRRSPLNGRGGEAISLDERNSALGYGRVPSHRPTQGGWPSPRLRMIEPMGDRREIVLDRPHMVIGRDPACAVHLADSRVSRQHAALDLRGGRLWLTDLGSANGTSVNGDLVRSARELDHGDVIACGGVRVMVETGMRSTHDATQTFPAFEQPRNPAADINNFGHLSGEIYQAGGDQYVQHLYQQRESFFAQIVATKTKARWLTWLGAIVSIAGIAVCLFAFSTFPDAISHSSTFGEFPPAFRTFFAGLIIGVVGQILLIIGIVLHVVATGRRRRLSNDPAYRLLPPIRQH